MVKVLDCTLRDGSHITNFSKDVILDTLFAAEKSGIDFIEVGYSMPEFITSKLPNSVVMINAKNITPVSEFAEFVRVACYPDEIKKAISAVEDYKSQGFGVFLHIMTADKFEDFDYLKSWQNKDILESLYFADSFGAMMPIDVERVYKNFQNCGFEKISFHAHNNLQLAFPNTIKAVELGAYCVDASVYGMGRGAGNLPIELLFKYLNKDYSEYLKLIKKHYISIRKENYWGYDYKNLIGGLENIHPSKVKAIE